MNQQGILLSSPTHIRKQISKQRRFLSAKDRQLAAFLASRHLGKLHQLLPKQAKIGLYLDAFGEMPTLPLLKFCEKYQYRAFAPITKPNQPLSFTPMFYNPQKNPLKKHRLGMKEPIAKHSLDACHMDAIICPLIAVDSTGLRLGMGGGYYDRTLVNLHRTLKIAWCYDFQVVAHLPKQPWDQAVDLIMTDKRLIRP